MAPLNVTRHVILIWTHVLSNKPASSLSLSGRTGISHKAKLIRLIALTVVVGGLSRGYRFDLPVEMECWGIVELSSTVLNINQVLGPGYTISHRCTDYAKYFQNLNSEKLCNSLKCPLETCWCCCCCWRRFSSEENTWDLRLRLCWNIITKSPTDICCLPSPPVILLSPQLRHFVNVKFCWPLRLVHCT